MLDMVPIEALNAEDYSVVVATTSYMEPEIRRDSLCFLGPAGYRGEILYSLPDPTGRHSGNFRRLTVGPGGLCIFTTDNAPLRQNLVMRSKREEFVAHDIRPIVAVLKPIDFRFGLWMRDRFEGLAA